MSRKDAHLRSGLTVRAFASRRASSTTSGGGNTSSQRGGSGRMTSLRDTAGGPKDGTKAELRRARR